MFARFCGGDAGVGGETVEMLEAIGVGPGRKMSAALLSKVFLKADDVGAGVRIARGDGAADAWVAAFKGDFADVETDYAAKFSAEKLVFPEWRDAVDFQSRAETQAGLRDRHAGEPFADGPERRRGDYRWAVGDEIVGNAVGIVANHDGVAQVFGEPFGCRGSVSRECKCGDGDLTAVAWSGEGDVCEIGSIGGADQVECGFASAADEAAIQCGYSPGAVELEAAGGAYCGGGHLDGVEGFDGMDLDVGQSRDCWFRFHAINSRFERFAASVIKRSEPRSLYYCGLGIKVQHDVGATSDAMICSL
jgi:hypothetical protein